MKARLHFTFGPVQSFVAQARRTRDLYAGSLLLSHLAMAAMKAVRGGKIILPDFDALCSVENKPDKPEHATAPNRFLAEFDSEDVAAEAGRAASQALRDEWCKIADRVWSRYLARAAMHGRRTAEIWERQRDHFWNVSWVVGTADEKDLLDRRKNWQTQSPPAEGGDHCVLMGSLQELSGFIRSKQRGEQDAFWNAVRAGTPDLDLELDERLCAVAFIKRLFPSISEEALGKKLDARSWPSTVTVAALPWMRTISAREDFHATARTYAETAVREHRAALGSWRRIRLLRGFPQEAGRFRELSGNFLNRTALANKDDTPLEDEPRRAPLLDDLRKLEKHTGGRAGNFYAVLLMDGDSMGALIGQHGPGAVTGPLTKFAADVPGVIAENDGVCVYAGGDDLLALLPLDLALNAASEAHRLYGESFGTGIPATVSAAIVYAHYLCTFSRVLSYAHELLDDVAKNQTGRDSLAVGVLKPGGVACQWSAPFAHFVRATPNIFEPLLGHFNAGRLTSGLLYNLRERFSQLIEGEAANFKRDELLALFTAEALVGKRDSGNLAAQRSETGALMDQMLDVCEQVRRTRETGVVKSTGVFDFEGPRLVKFLALDGKEGAA